MNTRNIDYSLKNIPVPSQSTYLKCLVDKVESFVKRLRWKVFWYEKKLQENQGNNPAHISEESDTENDEEEELRFNNFGFKSPRTPPQNIHLRAFEADLFQMINDVEFDSKRNHLQRQLKTDINLIRSSDVLTVPADKSPNLYEMDTNQYRRLLQNNVTTTYKKSPTEFKAAIDSEAKAIASSLNLADRIDCIAKKDAFITLKDHKENFMINPKCRLINPTKTEIGHISKAYLERIVADVTKATNFNQWRNTSTVINWFKEIPDKQRHRFVKFDICDFYPSISEDLVDKAIAFARLHTDVSEEEVRVIKHARKSLLFSGNAEWTKKNANNDLFDVTMGSFDGAELCELVGLYLLMKLQPLLGISNVGLYRDDGLAVVRSLSGRRLDQIRKSIIEVLKSEGLAITIQTNLPATDYLDVMLNLATGKHSPYRKPGTKPIYVHSKSNHPPNVIKEIPKMIGRRISDLSHDEEEFDRAKHIYEEALASSGHPSNLEYQPPVQGRKRNRHRAVTWFNPPFCSSVKTSIGKKFLQLVKRHFPENHRYASIINRNTVKISYSCLPNMGSIIKQQNERLLREPDNTNPRSCNCRNREQCPLNGACLTAGVTYAATVKYVENGAEQENLYNGSTSGTFKNRYSGHLSSFRHEHQENETELSKLIWKLKRRGVNYSISWAITKRAQPYKCGSRRCDLCLTEKVIIARCSHPGMINKRTELLAKCRHRNKYLLSDIKN